MVAPGQPAPDFAAPALVDGEGRLLELFTVVEDHDVVALLFYPADFVPTCTAELCAVRDGGWHGESTLAVLCVGADSLFSHAAYADRYDLPFPLVSDFHGGVADSYDLLAGEWEGHRDIPMRATVVLDGDWDVRAVETVEDPLDQTSPSPVERATESIRSAGVDVEKPSVDYTAVG